MEAWEIHEWTIISTEAMWEKRHGDDGSERCLGILNRGWPTEHQCIFPAKVDGFCLVHSPERVN